MPVTWRVGGLLVSLALAFLPLPGRAAPGEVQAAGPSLEYRASLYFDGFGTASEGSDLLGQLGTRIKFELTRAPSRSWRVLIDVRDRVTLAEGGGNQALVYNARVTFDSPTSPIYVSAGRMSLYDSAGIGQLLGALAGYRFRRKLLAGGYAGLEQGTYSRRLDASYVKYGVFARYTGPRALTMSLSFNEVRYSGRTERRYLYAQGVFPVRRLFYVFANAEYELGPAVRREDRLTRLFVNARLDISRSAEVTAFISSGRGLDFHAYVLETSGDPRFGDRDLERFFYSRQYGVRVAFKPFRGLRLFASRMESRQEDLDIRNHTWRLGGSLRNVLGSGITARGDYSFNRGTRSESDAFSISLDRDFGRMSASLSLANTFNSLRFGPAGDDARVIHLDGTRALSAFVSVPVTRHVSLAAEYSRFLMGAAGEHQIFVRLVLRK